MTVVVFWACVVLALACVVLVVVRLLLTSLNLGTWLRESRSGRHMSGSWEPRPTPEERRTAAEVARAVRSATPSTDPRRARSELDWAQRHAELRWETPVLTVLQWAYAATRPSGAWFWTALAACFTVMVAREVCDCLAARRYLRVVDAEPTQPATPADRP